MKILSVNIGLPKSVEWKGKSYQTGIFKHSVEKALPVSFFNIEGDGQADLNFHGGRDMAIYSYDISSYVLWEKYLQCGSLPLGQFGENLTTEGLPDSKIHVGDIYQIGDLVIQASLPRIPCIKLNVRFQRDDILKQFTKFKLFGSYFRVLTEGKLKAGKRIKLLERESHGVCINDMAICKLTKGKDQKLLDKICKIPSLSEKTRQEYVMFQNKA